MSLSDDLLTSALSGNAEEVFKAFFNRYYAKMKRFVNGLCRDEPLAEDIVQDIFLDIWIHRDRLHEIRSMDAWLFICARNAALKAIRNQFRLSPQTSSDGPVANTTEEDLYLQELRAALDRNIADMPPRQQKVFRMSRYEGKTNHEIATELNISKRTVETYISSALTTLRKIRYMLLFL